MRRIVDADEHPVDDKRIVDAEGHRGMTPRLRAARHADRALDRHVGGDDHVFGMHRPASGHQAPAARLAYQYRSALFEYAAAVVRHSMCQPDEIFCRIELRLVGKTKRARGLEGQRCAIEHPCFQPDLSRRLCLGDDRFAPLPACGIGIGILAFQIAGDGIFPDPVLDQRGSSRIRLGIAPRPR